MLNQIDIYVIFAVYLYFLIFIFISKIEHVCLQIGVKSDVWSLGCILYNLVYGKTPFQHIRNPLMKFSVISNPATVIDFPSIKDTKLLDVMKLCLQYESQNRPHISELLKHPYLKEEAMSSPKPKQEMNSVLQQISSLTPKSLNRVQLVSINLLIFYRFCLNYALVFELFEQDLQFHIDDDHK